MKERGEINIRQWEKDNKTLDFGSRQAQEAILDPNFPEHYKDLVLEAAIGTIREVAESKSVYFAKHGEGRWTRRPK
jgi:hypothetical protein